MLSTNSRFIVLWFVAKLDGETPPLPEMNHFFSYTPIDVAERLGSVRKASGTPLGIPKGSGIDPELSITSIGV